MRKSVPQARQNWLSCRSSDPQDGQYMSGHYTARAGRSSFGIGGRRPDRLRLQGY